MEGFIAQLTYVLADEVIVHSDYASVRGRCRGRRSRAPRVVPHANYIGAFPPDARDRAELRQWLKLPAEGYVYLAFGQVRQYKRLTHLAEEFRRLEAADSRLLIAGRPGGLGEAERLQAYTRADPRIVLRLEHIPEQSVSGIHQACDAAVITYRDVFSSGALLLGLSYRVPVVVPGAGTARELFAEPAVELVENDDPA